MSVRVAFDITPGLLIKSGVGRYPRELRPALERLENVELVPLAATQDPANPRARRLLEACFREGLYYPALLSRRALRAGADVIHCPAPAPVRSGDTPVVVTVHDLLPLTHPALLPRMSVVHARASLPFVRGAGRILTNSDHTRQEVIARLGMAPERVVATPFGVNGRFRPLQPEPDWVMSRFGVGERFLLSVGTLEPRKNLAGLLRAFAILRRSVEDCELLLVGAAGWRNHDFAATLHESDGVRLAGFVSDEDLVRLYSTCVCFVYPSLAEGFGLPPLEAMACGAAVIASDRPAMPEILGDAALLCDPADDDALASAMERVLGDDLLREELRQRGIRRSGSFSWDRCAEATARVYQQVVDEARS